MMTEDTKSRTERVSVPVGLVEELMTWCDDELDECDEAIERIKALERQVRKLEKENQDMRDRLAKVYAISDVSRL